MKNFNNKFFLAITKAEEERNRKIRISELYLKNKKLRIFNRLGYKKDAFTFEYFSFLKNSVKNYSYLGAIPYKPIMENYRNEDGNISFEKDPDYEYYDRIDIDENTTHIIPINYDVTHFLLDEIRLKRKAKSRTNIDKESISASDLSSYTYCPIAFSISNTFHLQSIKSAENGVSLHDSNFLLRLKEKSDNYYYRLSEEKSIKINNDIIESNKDFFDEIKLSEIIYQGHGSQDGNIIFRSKKGKYSASPDYIFKNSNGEYFVVEEKFRKESNINNSIFYKNHVNQIRSYILGINNNGYEINHGYLIYWKYENEFYDEIELNSCRILKISKHEIDKNYLNEIYLKIFSLIKNGKEKFNPNNRNPIVCANCAVGYLCGHKTGKFDFVTYPYNKDHNKV